ncbi:cellulase family glycosylhydrolase [Kouleothrix sp.]|uniref:cellulase family glycosylhydrolase n=1 Tax=Kouleothrix sp. TaxID=2779161 RepID=UPI00391C2CD2
MLKYRFHYFIIALLAMLMLFSISGSYTAKAAPSITYVGVNLAGAEFGVDFDQNKLPGQYGQDYTYPTHNEVDYFIGKGMNTFRIPFRWERLQRAPMIAFDKDEQARLDDIVQYATNKQAFVVLDPHNYARYYDASTFKVIGQDWPISAFIDFWKKLATRYKGNSHIIFGLMNEPHDMPTDLWLSDANAAISAIRATGAKNLILVPGNYWSSALNWPYDFGSGSNAVSLLNIKDPKNNYAFEVHQYLNANSNGADGSCVSPTIGTERLQAFTSWLQQYGKRGFLGEFAGGRNDTCYDALDRMLNYIDANANVWIGWTYWAAGPLWGDYEFTIEPQNGIDRPQIVPLSKHIRGATPSTSTPTRVPPTKTPTSTPTPIPATCQITYVISKDWGNGFIADIKIVNKLLSPINKWKLRWTYADKEVVTDSWNAAHAQSGRNVTISGVSWNVNFPADSSITFEIQGTYSGTNSVPKNFTLQNRSCTVQ